MCFGDMSCEMFLKIPINLLKVLMWYEMFVLYFSEYPNGVEWDKSTIFSMIVSASRIEFSFNQVIDKGIFIGVVILLVTPFLSE